MNTSVLIYHSPVFLCAHLLLKNKMKHILNNKIFINQNCNGEKFLYITSAKINYQYLISVKETKTLISKSN